MAQIRDTRCKSAKRTFANSLPGLTLLVVLASAFLLVQPFALTVHAVPSRPQETPPAQQSDSSSQLAAADEALREMSRITGLPIKAPLQKKIVSRPEIKKYLTNNLHAEYTSAELHAQEAALRAFGLVGRDFNLEKFLVGFYTEQAAGLYDPRTKTMYMADWIPVEIQKMVLAHELTHALQDQNFDLDKFVHAQRDNDDATNARQAVAEGHAMAAMMQLALGDVDLARLPSLKQKMASVVGEQLDAFPAFAQAPLFFRLQALFPYLQGMEFMQHGLTIGGWKELNILFTEPPASTKEFFEPDVYFQHKRLPQISFPNPPPFSNLPGLHLLAENTMGELGYYAVVGQLISEDEAKPVALSWLADRYLLYELSDNSAAGEELVLVSRTKWASGEKAQAFFRDYRTILQKKIPALSPDARSTADRWIAGAAGNQVILVRDGDEVRWVEGISPAQTDSMLKYLDSL